MTSVIIEDMAALLVKVGSCPLSPDLAGEVRNMLERMKEEGFYPDPKRKHINLDWIQWLERVEKGAGIDWLLGYCGHQDKRGICPESCPYKHNGDGCNAYTAGIDALAHWLFEERKVQKERTEHELQ